MQIKDLSIYKLKKVFFSKLGLFITVRKICVTLVNNFTLDMSKIKSVEKEKIIAEKLNGRFAMIGFIAAVGAYLTTGQIIPGFV